MQKIRMKQKKGMTIGQGVEEFIRKCKVKNYSKYTIKYYDNNIHVFSLFCSLDNEIEVITEDLVNQYILYLQEDLDIRDYTVMSYVKAIRTLFYFFMKRDYIDEFKIPLPKADKELKEVYTEDELKALLKKPNTKKCGFFEYRNWVISNYLIATGQRLRNIEHLKIKDLDFENQIVKLSQSKSRKQVLLPMSSSIVSVLMEYLRYRKGEPEDYVFCKTNGNKMSKTGIEQAIVAYNHKRGITKTSIHLYRHTYAKSYLMNGGDICRLQKLLCHSDITITKEYLNLIVDDLQVDYDMYNPHAQIVGNNAKIKMKNGRK